MEWEQQTRGDPLPRGVTQVCAAWVEIICNPSYSGEYRINFISSLILPILLRNWSYITEAVPMCWSQKGDLWLWLVSSEPRANSPASYSIRAIYYSCVLQYWRISASWLLPSAHLVQLHVLFQASHCSRVLQYSRALVLKRIIHKKSEPKSVVRQFPRVLQYSRALLLMRLTVLAHMQGYLMAAAMCSQGFILVSACYMVASSYHASYSIRACHLTHVGLSISLQEIWTLEHSPCFTSPAEVKDRVSCRQCLTWIYFIVMCETYRVNICPLVIQVQGLLQTSHQV